MKADIETRFEQLGARPIASIFDELGTSDPESVSFERVVPTDSNSTGLWSGTSSDSTRRSTGTSIGASSNSLDSESRRPTACELPLSNTASISQCDRNPPNRFQTHVGELSADWRGSRIRGMHQNADLPSTGRRVRGVTDVS
ncbi:hypothetical protein [Haladaptatus sp. W1]|uniref:hypothetical protein n=1 Tax=Haladaptatus sp. W1 TaxID=1897478 RepID=UPI0020C7B78F|nr:hypothetical protein [Haladaptatus sp. W1]